MSQSEDMASPNPTPAPVRVQCRCGKRLIANTSHIGKRIRCPGCGETVSVPATPVIVVNNNPDTARSTRRKLITIESLYVFTGLVAVASIAFVVWYLSLPTPAEIESARLRLHAANAAAQEWLEIEDPDVSEASEIVMNLETAISDRAITKNTAEKQTLTQVKQKLAKLTPAGSSNTSKVASGDISTPGSPAQGGWELPRFLSSGPMTTEEIIRNSERAVVMIKGATSSGTGFVIDRNLIVTNKHVIRGESLSALEVYFPSEPTSGKGPFKTTLVYEDPRLDLAVLEIDRPEVRPLRLANSTEFRRGLDVVVIGSPGLDQQTVLENAVSRGILSTTANLDGIEYHQLSIAVNPGNSGGPVLDDQGCVIGVVTLKSPTKEAVAFSIPSADLKKCLGLVKQQSAAERETVQRNHTIRSITTRIIKRERINERIMSLYAEGMRASIAAGGTASGFLDKLDKRNKSNLEINAAMKRDLAAFAIDSTISESIRSKIADLWANQLEIESYIDSPRGTLLTYEAKLLELSDTHKRLCNSLETLLGYDLDDE